MTDIQMDRLIRKRFAVLEKTLRRRHAKIRQAKRSFDDLKSACLRLGAWDRSV